MESLKIQVGGQHYKVLKIQPVEYIYANNLGYLEGNVIKYVTRHKLKNGRQDLEKAIHYLQLLLEHEYPTVDTTKDALERLRKAVNNASGN